MTDYYYLNFWYFNYLPISFEKDICSSMKAFYFNFNIKFSQRFLI